MLENELDHLFPKRNQHILGRLFVDGPGRLIGRPLYNAVIALELGVQHAIDQLRPPEPVDQTPLNSRLTAVIKTFERPHDLQRLLASIRRFYPDMPLIVVDDSRQPQIQPGAETITMPFDSGLSAGRNEGVRRVKTPYFLLLDDDFIFYRQTDLPGALAKMEAQPQIDIMGGEVVNLPLFQIMDYQQLPLYPTEAQATLPPGSMIGGLPVFDIVPNFFIARSDRLRQVMWDDRFKRGEHRDFFTRAKGVLTTVYNKELRCLHTRTVFDEAYLSHRFDMAGTRDYVLTHYYGFSRAQERDHNGVDNSAAE